MDIFHCRCVTSLPTIGKNRTGKNCFSLRSFFGEQWWPAPSLPLVYAPAITYGKQHKDSTQMGPIVFFFVYIENVLCFLTKKENCILGHGFKVNNIHVYTALEAPWRHYFVTLHWTLRQPFLNLVE